MRKYAAFDRWSQDLPVIRARLPFKDMEAPGGSSKLTLGDSRPKEFGSVPTFFGADNQ